MKHAEHSLTPEQIQGLVQMLGLTRDREFDCGECLRNVGEFAEFQLAGHPLSETLACVEHHLTVCPECREEYTALLNILNGGR